MKTIHPVLSLIVLLFIQNISMFAEVSLPILFSDHMVLQRNIETPVWGKAKPGEKIVVTFKTDNYKTKTDKNGDWKINIKPEIAGGPYQLSIKGNNTVTYNDVMIGDVWICSGQSNMEWPLWNTIKGEEDVAKSENNNIRLFHVNNAIATTPQNKIPSDGWEICNPASVKYFSAVGYYFGFNLEKELNIPIGLISTNWGGTMVESWTSPDACQDNEYLKEWFNKISVFNYEEKLKTELIKINLYKAEWEKVSQPDYSPTFSNSDNNNSWKTMQIPTLWEGTAIGDFDGIVWFRKSFEIPPNADLKNITLSLGKVDDTDITWINGVKVGETYKDYQKPREYKIPGNVLKPGKNQIIVRVEDYVGGGGIYDTENLPKLEGNDLHIALKGEWQYQVDKTPVIADPENPENSVLGPNDYPTLLFNGMINPLIPYGIKGAIWYQGEANANWTEQSQMYNDLLTIMIKDWRAHWGLGDFPFIQTQLANYLPADRQPKDHSWAHLRESQTKVTQNLPNVGMACIIDIGEANDIHPRNKKDVGYRLALQAFNMTYNKDIVYTGPTKKSVEYKGDKAIVIFENTGEGIMTNDRYGYINGFAVAGDDKKFYYAKATITNQNTIEVSCNMVNNIKAIRYAWAANPDDVNLYNSANLPALPFRTDNW